MRITSATFIKSAYRAQEYPSHSYPEVAFAGKSNVGKSSLINTLLNRKNLAHTSSTPGRTQCINFFLISTKLSFVDLPGYGFAKVPIEVKRRWKPMVEAYLSSRKNLGLVIVILDCRRQLTEDDSNLLEWLKFLRIPFVVVITKVDKVSQNEKQKQKTLVREALAIERDQVILFSAVTGEGKEAVWKKILEALVA